MNPAVLGVKSRATRVEPHAYRSDPNYPIQSTAWELLALAIREQGEVVAVSTAVMEKIAYRAGVPNVVALLQRRDIRLSEIQLSPNPLVLVLENV